MKAIRMKQKLILSALAGAILVPGSAITVRAADNSTENTPVIPVAGIESARMLPVGGQRKHRPVSGTK